MDAKPPHAAEMGWTEERVHRNRDAVRLLERWLEDETGFDERVWPKLKQAIEENRLSSRPRFDG